MIRVGTRINVRPHARKKQVWGKVVLERVVVVQRLEKMQGYYLTT